MKSKVLRGCEDFRTRLSEIHFIFLHCAFLMMIIFPFKLQTAVNMFQAQILETLHFGNVVLISSRPFRSNPSVRSVDFVLNERLIAIRELSGRNLLMPDSIISST